MFRWIHHTGWEWKVGVWLWKGRMMIFREERKRVARRKRQWREIIDEGGSRQRKQRRMAPRRNTERERSVIGKKGSDWDKRKPLTWLRSSSFTFSLPSNYHRLFSLRPSTHHHSISDVKKTPSFCRKKCFLSYRMCFECWTLSLPTFLLICSASAGQVESKQRTQSAKLIRELCRREVERKRVGKLWAKFVARVISQNRRHFVDSFREPRDGGAQPIVRRRVGQHSAKDRITHHFFNSHTFYSSRQSLRLIVKIIKINCLRFCFHHELSSLLLWFWSRGEIVKWIKKFSVRPGRRKKREIHEITLILFLNKLRV